MRPQLVVASTPHGNYSKLLRLTRRVPHQPREHNHRNCRRVHVSQSGGTIIRHNHQVLLVTLASALFTAACSSEGNGQELTVIGAPTEADGDPVPADDSDTSPTTTLVDPVVGPSHASSDDPVQPQSLSEIPGFRTSEGGLADDTILLWEVFSREKYVQNCMSQAGFDYNLAFPLDLPAVADWLGIVADDDSVSGEVGQGGSQQGLLDDLMTTDSSPVPVAEGDQYFMALYGETAADVAYVESTGFLPEGRNDFARGGCVGAAWDAIPRLSELPRELSDEVREERAIEMADAAPCVTPNGVTLENLGDMEWAYVAALESGESTQDVESCAPALERENEAASERARATVFARHKQRLLRQYERYGSIVEDVIKPDEQFSQYLRDALIRREDDLGPQLP